MKRFNQEIRFPSREIAAFAIGFGLAIATVLAVSAMAPAQNQTPTSPKPEPLGNPMNPKPPMAQTPQQPKPMQPMTPKTQPTTPMRPKTPPMPTPNGTQANDTTKKTLSKDTTTKTLPKDGKDPKDVGKKVDNALAGKSTDQGKGLPKGNDAGSKSGDKSTAGVSKDFGSGSAKSSGDDKLGTKPKIDPHPLVRPGMPANPGGVSTPRGGPIVATMPKIGSERWERLRRHPWRGDWDWGHRFWGPDYGTGNTFTFQNTYTVENSGNTTQQFDYSRPLAGRGKDSGDQTDKSKGSDSKNSDDAQASKDKGEAGVDAGKMFDQARASFKDGDFDKALEQVNAAIEKRPSDATLHEFKALCLFAQGKFEEAAPVLYAVISAGPGWDAETMSSFYADYDTYQKQFKALRDFVAEEPDTGFGHFVLAYHYLVQGQKTAAVKELREVTRTQPGDKLSAELAKVLAA